MFHANRQDIVTNPCLIVEVLLPSTSNYDRGMKFVHYRSIPSLTDYMVIAQDSVHAEYWTRQADNSWLLREHSSPADTTKIVSVGAEIRLADVYAGVTFDE